MMTDVTDQSLSSKAPKPSPDVLEDRLKGIDLSILYQVCGGGAIGGLLYWSTGGAVSGWAGLFAPVIAAFGGACAAGIGVFVLANSETKNRLRLIFFSLICGLSYPVVLEAAKKVAPTQQEQDVERVKEAVRDAPVRNTGDLVDVLTANPALDTDPQLGKDLANATTKAIEQISTEAEEPRKVEALKDIGVAAADSGYGDQAREAIKQLDELKTDEASKAKTMIEAKLLGKDASAEVATEAGNGVAAQ